MSMQDPRAERDRLLELVRRIGELGSLKLPVDGLLREVVHAAQGLTGASGAVVAVLEGDGLEYRAVSGRLETHRGLRIPGEGSLAGLALQRREVVYSADTEDDPRVHVERVRETGARSMLAAPLLHGTDAVGVLKVVCDRAGGFDEIHEHAVQMCAQFVAGVLARQQAVDEHARLVAQQRTALARLQTVLDASPAATIVHDLDGRVEMWNPAATRLLGWTADEVIGRLPPWVPPAQMAGFLELTRRIVRGEARAEQSVDRFRKDGSVIRVRVGGAPLRDGHGAVTGVVRVLEEVGA
jgi:PAS domain S-box-containing protein